MKKYSIIAFVILFMYMFVLGAIALSESMFFSLYTTGMSIYLVINILMLIAFGVCIVWLYRKSNDEASFFGTNILTTTMLLHLGSSIMLILLYFLSGSTFKKMVEISNKVFVQSLILIGISAFTCWGISFLKKFLNKSGMCVVLVLILSSTISLFAGVIMALFNEDGSTIIKGIQVGLISCYLAIVQFSLIVYSADKEKLKGMPKNKRTGLIAYAVISILALIVGYIASSEYGIPMFLTTSISIWYIFYKRKSNIKIFKINLTFLIIAVYVLLIVSMLVYYYCVQQEIISSEAFGNLGDKISRMFPPKDEDNTRFIQRNDALSRLATSGFFGSYDYRYVYAAKTDYSIALTTHYVGWFWLIIVLVSFCFTIISGNKYWMKNKSEFHDLETISCISFIYIFLVSFYNILSNTGIVGIIGVSCFASGYGYSNSILSGLLLGSVLYNIFESASDKEKLVNANNSQISKLI